MLALGMFFGAAQTSVTAFSQQQGTASHAGIIYAMMGLGAAITALGSVILPDWMTYSMRIVLGGSGLALGSVFCSIVPSPIYLAVAVFLTGLATHSASVAIFTLAGTRAPRGGDAVAVTALGSVNVLGVATSASVTGQIVEYSASYGFYVCALAGILIAVATLVSDRNKLCA